MRTPRPAPVLLRSKGWWAVVVLVLLPTFAFAIPAFLGHPTLPGDDLTQNFPLRVLAGQQIRAGHLPVFAADLWSGSPLLAGWNAGAAYPLTLLFALLPGTGAWTLNLIVTWSVAGLSTYYLCRALRLAVVPSLLAAVSFAYAGEMSSQIVHFGLVTGMAWLPLQILAVRRVADATTGSSRRRWTGVLGLGLALTFLAGEPRAIDDTLLVVALFGAWTLARLERGRLGAAVAMGVGLGVGVCAGALQWLPGAIAVSTSQRAASSAALFTSGSLPTKWLLLLVEPNLLGGTGSFGAPHFAGSYGLLEVTGYVGIFPLVAAVMLLARLRRGSGVPEWLIWHVVAAVGVLFALGGSTPLWHVFAHIPLFGGQRLQSRNLLVADFALALLLAYWSDGALRSPPAGEGGGREDRRRELTFGSLPVVVAGVAVVAVLVGGDRFVRWLAGPGATVGAGSYGAWQLPFLLVDVAAVLWILFRRRMSETVRTVTLTGLVAADLVVFTVCSVIAVAASPAATPALARTEVPPPSGAPVRSIASLGYPGRFAIYNPDQLQEGDLATLGSPDLNVLTATPSVQGYSAIVDGHYAATTGTHVALGNGQSTLSLPAIADGTLDQLDTTLLVTVPQYLLGVVGGVGGDDGNDRPTAGRPTQWFFGTTLPVSGVAVPYRGGAGAADRLQLGLSDGGRTTWLVPNAVDGRLEVRLPAPLPSTGVELRSTGGLEVGAPTLDCGAVGSFVADGPLQGYLTAPHWRYAGGDGPFAVFANNQSSGPIAVEPTGAGEAVQVDGGATVEGASAVVHIRSARGARIRHSVAAIPGWSATWTPAGGPPSTLPVHTQGVVQVVTVPPGRGTLTWSYHAPGLIGGLVLTAFGAAGLVVLLGGRPRRRARRRHAEASGAPTRPPG